MFYLVFQNLFSSCISPFIPGCCFLFFIFCSVNLSCLLCLDSVTCLVFTQVPWSLIHLTCCSLALPRCSHSITCRYTKSFFFLFHSTFFRLYAREIMSFLFSTVHPLLFSSSFHLHVWFWGLFINSFWNYTWLLPAFFTVLTKHRRLLNLLKRGVERALYLFEKP